MISYNTKDWFTFITRFHKADTFRQLFPLILAISAYSGIIAWLELDYWKLSEKIMSVISLSCILYWALLFRCYWYSGRTQLMTAGGRSKAVGQPCK